MKKKKVARKRAATTKAQPAPPAEEAEAPIAPAYAIAGVDVEDAQCKQLAQCGMAVLSLFTGSRHSKVKATRILRANGIELESSIEIG